MSNKNLLSGKDKALAELVENYETARDQHISIYMDAEDLADIAEWYDRNSKFDDAAEVIAYGLKLHPGNTSLLVERSYLHLDLYELEDAKQAAAEITEERPDVTILRARLLVEERRIEDAELQLDMLEDKYSKENIIDVAYMYLGAYQYDQATEWLSHWRWDKEDTEYCCIMADSLLDRKNYAEALTYYNKLIDNDPYHPQYWMAAARCYMGMQEFGKAIDACDYALLTDDELGEAYVIKGYCFLELGNDEEAVKCYEQAVKFHSIAPAYLNSMVGQIKLEKEEWEKAYNELDLALQQEEDLKDPITRSSLYAGMAICIYKLGNEKYEGQALDYCHKAIDIDYLNVDAHLLGGLIYAQRGERQKAVDMWEEIGSYDNTADTWSEIAAYSTEAGMYRYSVSALEHIEQWKPDYPNLYQRLTMSCILSGETEKARHYNQQTESPMNEKYMENLQTQVETMPDGETMQVMKTYLTEPIRRRKG